MILRIPSPAVILKSSLQISLGSGRAGKTCPCNHLSAMCKLVEPTTAKNSVASKIGINGSLRSCPNIVQTLQLLSSPSSTTLSDGHLWC